MRSPTASGKGQVNWTGPLKLAPPWAQYGAGSFDLKRSALFAAGVFFAGVVGDTTGGILSDRILRKTGDVGKARISVIVIGFLGILLLHVADRFHS